jgi:hypothetical protein
MCMAEVHGIIISYLTTNYKFILTRDAKKIFFLTIIRNI